MSTKVFEFGEINETAAGPCVTTQSVKWKLERQNLKKHENGKNVHKNERAEETVAFFCPFVEITRQWYEEVTDASEEVDQLVAVWSPLILFLRKGKQNNLPSHHKQAKCCDQQVNKIHSEL